MTAGGRTRLYTGILFVVILVAALFVYLNYTMSRVVSQSAQLESNAYGVSIDYSGIIEKQYVDVGQKVKKNDKLFEIKSSSLAEALNADRVQKSSLLFELTPSSNIIVKASADGVVRTVNFREGSYIPANAEAAKIDIADSLYVMAKYRLRAADYGRVNRGNMVEVTLPDNTKLEAKVFDVSLQRTGEQVDTIVKARFENQHINTVVFASGTPVETTWRLNNSKWYDTVTNGVKQLFVPYERS
jgi:multidrug resistance efflux pump